MINLEDEIGKKYGRLKVLSIKSEVQRLVNCKCDCGTKVTALLYTLRAGNKRSCGCLRTDNSRDPKMHTQTIGRIDFIDHNRISIVDVEDFLLSRGVHIDHDECRFYSGDKRSKEYKSPLHTLAAAILLTVK